MSITISIIAAMAKNRCIGVKNSIPWHIPEDFKYFKRTTMGKPMVMGRKTFESLPGILPGRAHIVVSRSAPPKSVSHDDVHYAPSIEGGLEIARGLAKASGEDEIFIIGGAQIYKQALENGMADRLYLTYVDQAPDGDAYFPEFDLEQWTETRRDQHDGFKFVLLERR